MRTDTRAGRRSKAISHIIFNIIYKLEVSYLTLQSLLVPLILTI
jgi:hypothetical protein